MDDAPQAPAPQPAPPPPNYAAATREGVMADIETMPLRKRIEYASRQGIAYTDPETGKVYDFTGLGEGELAKTQAAANAESADIQARSNLDIQKKYGAEYTAEALKRLGEADPTGLQARRELAAGVLKDYQLGSSLSPEEEAQTESQIRGAQAARGNILGNAASAREAIAKTELGQKLKQQRMANVAAYVQGTPLTAQYQNLSATQSGAAPYMPVAYAPGVGLNPNAGAAGAGFASSIYGQQSANVNAANQYGLNAWNMQMNAPNPWMQGLGMVTGMGASALGTGKLF